MYEERTRAIKDTKLLLFARSSVCTRMRSRPRLCLYFQKPFSTKSFLFKCYSLKSDYFATEKVELITNVSIMPSLSMLRSCSKCSHCALGKCSAHSDCSLGILTVSRTSLWSGKTWKARQWLFTVAELSLAYSQGRLSYEFITNGCDLIRGWSLTRREQYDKLSLID